MTGCWDARRVKLIEVLEGYRYQFTEEPFSGPVPEDIQREVDLFLPQDIGLEAQRSQPVPAPQKIDE